MASLSSGIRTNDTKEEEKSSVQEVRTWYNRTQLTNTSTHHIQAANSIVPTRKGYINALAEEVYNTIKTYNVKLPHTNITKPTSFKKAGNLPMSQWFQAEEKIWKYLDQKDITPEIRRKALRCHHLYDIKRDLSAKNRVVVNGSKQNQDTYTDTTSPVAGQLLLRLFLTITAFRQCDIIQLDLTNAYLHAPIQDGISPCWQYCKAPQSYLWHKTRSQKSLRLHGNCLKTHWLQQMPQRPLPLSLPAYRWICLLSTAICR
jgi:hypothetical protein